VQEIGSGGMGIIYLAYHLNLQKYVVIKKIKDDYVGRIDVRNEADIMKNLSHTYLPHIYDFIQLGTEVYTVMNYIEGVDFSYYIKAGYRFTEEQLIKWMTQCLEVLEYLHTHKPAIIHRDIKPGNIMLDKEGNICVIDFNISFDENLGKNIIAASAAYASPEQLHPNAIKQADGSMAYSFSIDTRTDIYSLGATFFHLATGIKPKEGIIQEYPITKMELGYSEAFSKIIEKSMQSNPDARYQSAKEMLQDVKNIYKHTKRYHLLRISIIAGACMAGLLIGCVGVYIYKNVQNKRLAEFEHKYNQVIQLSSEDNPSNALEEALQILNEDSYKEYYEDYPVKKGMLLYEVAMSYFELGDYSEANTYYEEALYYIDDAGCIRDYAISLAKTGQLSEAEAVVEKNQQMLDVFDLKAIQAGIAFMKGDYESSEENLIYILNYCTNMDTRSRNIIVLCEVYDIQKKYEEIIQVLTENVILDEYINKKELFLANAYIGLASDSDVSESREYYANAKTYLEDLKQKDLLNLDEAVNLIIIYQNIGDLVEAEKYINELLEEYPGDYRLLVQQCFLDYNRELQKEAVERTYSLFKKHYESAIEAYSSQSGNSQVNASVEQLKYIFQELKDKGVL
jgi:serine/threonine protein kinase